MERLTSMLLTVVTMLLAYFVIGGQVYNKADIYRQKTTTGNSNGQMYFFCFANAVDEKT